MVRTRRYGVAALLTAVVLALAACSEEEPSSSQGGDTSGPIKVGAVLDITGAGASLGVPERKTLELLTKQTNDGGGVNGRQLQLIIEDNQSDEATAAKAMNKLVSQDKVDLVIGATRTGTSLAMKPIAESSKMPMISLAANKKIVDGATWVYKTAQNDQVVLENMIDLARQRGWKTIGLARDASAFGEGVQETLTQLGSGDGIKVVRTEKFAPDATDFTAQMVNLREAGADVNIIWGIPPAVALAQKAYRQLGIKAPVLQSHGIGNQVFLETAGASADGLIAPLGRLLVADQLPADDPQKQVLQRFIDSYSGAYAGERPSTFAGHAYDAFQLALEAFKAAGTDKQGVRDHLEQVKNLPLITGVFTMTPQDHSGLTKEALVLVTVDGQKWRLVPGS
jgi:branched-chain amino acid transport system substrate-binding protein